MAASPSAERPLSANEVRRLLAKAGACLVLLAALVLTSVVAVAFALLLEAALGLVLLRFGIGIWLLRWMEGDLRVLWILIRSLGPGAKPGPQMTLAEQDAPGLHSTVRRICQRMGATPPKRIVLEMGATAWIRLEGWITGRGRSVLGVGHDLLAALSVDEVEAVLAHEVAHALRVNRGFRNTFFGAARRCATLCVGLENECARRRAENRPEALAQLILVAAEPLCRWTHRLLASASRQDEFEADREAALHYGSDRFASALLRLEAASVALGRLTDQERLARLEMGEGFSQWLSELAAKGQPAGRPGEEASAPDPFSTHPTNDARIAAVSAIPGRPEPDPRVPGSVFLSDAEDLVRRLVQSRREELARLEREDIRAHARSFHRARGLLTFRLPAWVPWTVGGISVPMILVPWFLPAPYGSYTILSLYGFFVLAVAAALQMLVYRERWSPPIPEYRVLCEGDPDLQGAPELSEVERRITQELEQRIRPGQGRSQPQSERRRRLLEEAHSALTHCRYLRAYTAGRMLAQDGSNRPEDLMILAVGSGALGLADQAYRFLRILRSKSGLSTFGAAWTEAWTHLLLSNSGEAASALELCRRRRPDEPILNTLLLTAHRQRGRFETAIALWNQGTFRPGNDREVHLVSELFLAAGRPREALAILASDESLCRSSHLLSLDRVQAHLLRGEQDTAREWSDIHLAAAPDGRSRIRLARIHEQFRLDEQAEGWLRRVLGEGFHPEAHVGLARLAWHRGDVEGTRRELDAAIDNESPLGRDALPAGALLNEILRFRMVLDARREGLRVWRITCVPTAPKPLCASVWISYATDGEAADRQMHELSRLLFRSGPPPLPNSWKVEKAPAEQQPTGPCHPGLLPLSIPHPR